MVEAGGIESRPEFHRGKPGKMPLRIPPIPPSVGPLMPPAAFEKIFTGCRRRISMKLPSRSNQPLGCGRNLWAALREAQRIGLIAFAAAPPCSCYARSSGNFYLFARSLNGALVNRSEFFFKMGCHQAFRRAPRSGRRGIRQACSPARCRPIHSCAAGLRRGS